MISRVCLTPAPTSAPALAPVSVSAPVKASLKQAAVRVSVTFLEWPPRWPLKRLSRLLRRHPTPILMGLKVGCLCWIGLERTETEWLEARRGFECGCAWRVQMFRYLRRGLMMELNNIWKSCGLEFEGMTFSAPDCTAVIKGSVVYLVNASWKTWVHSGTWLS